MIPFVVGVALGVAIGILLAVVAITPKDNGKKEAERRKVKLGLTPHWSKLIVYQVDNVYNETPIFFAEEDADVWAETVGGQVKMRCVADGLTPIKDLYPQLTYGGE